MNPPTEKDFFYYHGDHLGSSNMITDGNGAVYQHLEYFPYGETWIEEGGSYGGNTPGYKFTGKELDPETGLYYYGARYYDSVLSKWISADPIFGKYLPTGNKDRDQHLPGMGGVYNSANLGLYSYSHNNPITYIDPDGLLTIIVHGTFARSADYAQQGAAFQKAVSSTFKENAVAFNWAGGNNVTDRSAGARALSKYVQQHKFKPGEKLNIVAHSHGGNVVKEYTQLKESKKIDTLVNLGTPQRGDYNIDPKKVGQYLNVYSDYDQVQTIGGRLGDLGSAGRTDPKASKNIDVSFPVETEMQTEMGSTSITTGTGHSALHTVPIWNAVEKDIQ